MENFQLLNDFIDGNLAPGQEEQFFLYLSSSEEMRLKLKQMMTVKTAIQSNSGVFNPPAEATMGVFSALGFSAAGVDGASASNAGFLSRFSGTFGKYSQAITASAITAVIVILLMWKLLDSGNYSYPFGSGSINNDNISLNINPIFPKSMSSSSAIEKSEPENIRTVIKYVYLPAKESDAVDNPSVQDRMESIPPLENFGSDLPTQEYSLSDTRNQLFPEVMSENTSDLFSGLSDIDSRISLEVRGTQYWSSPVPTISPSSFAKFNNNAVAVFYELNDNWMVGAEIRQENFYQEFTGIDQHGVETYYEQQPNFTSYGITARYIYKDLITDISPIAQGILGFNNAGFIWRGMAGLEYSPFNHVSFIAGLEYSHLVFKHQGESFNSKKFGFNYGVSVKF